jgi:MFS family permease
MTQPSLTNPNLLNAAVVVAGLGYFVDIYDLLLFSIVRIPSLESLGQNTLDNGIFLINMQMAGMLIGGILWGVLGDKKGRLSVLFGSIFFSRNGIDCFNITYLFIFNIDTLLRTDAKG